MKLDIDHLMKGLSKQRPIFHSEADFQHALAWRIHKTMPDCQVRLEYPFLHEKKRRYLDIWLPTERIAIELKYRTRKIEMDCDDESFALTNQNAQDEGQYDYLWDLQRLEYLVKDKEQSARTGVAVLLTNDPFYWNAPSCGWKDTTDAAFRLHESRRITDNLVGRIKSRRDPVYLNGSYKMRWKDYSNFPGEKDGKFRYLAVSVQ